MTILTIIEPAPYARFEESRPDMLCVDETGKKHYVDIWVDGKFADNITGVDVIGTRISCELIPHIEIANFIEIIPQPTEANHD